MNLMQGKSVETFNPDRSAKILKLKVEAHSRITEEIVFELHMAREYFSGKGRNQYSSVPDGTKLTSFESYLEEVGLARRTAYNWLERFIPEENKLLTYEEFSQKKIEAERAKLSKEERDRLLISEFRKTGTRPHGWTPHLEERVKKDDEAFARQKERLEKERQRREQRSQEQREQQEKITHAERPARTFLSDALLTATNVMIEKYEKKIAWKEKIRLSDGGKDDAFMDAIIEYLETLPDDNRRIEACNNIIKICRNISVELQKANIQ